MISAKKMADAERQLAQRDPRMATLIQRHGPCTIGRKRRDSFTVLCASIISQQLSSKAADTIQKRVMLALGAEKDFTPAHFNGVNVAQLRACGLSNAKGKWLLALAERVGSGTLDLAQVRKMKDADAMQTLDDLPGIGPWTAEMLLMFAFDRIDIYSMGDLGLRRGAELVYNRKRKLSDKKLLQLTASWTPHRSIASWYLWRAIEDGENSGWT